MADVTDIMQALRQVAQAANAPADPDREPEPEPRQIFGVLHLRDTGSLGSMLAQRRITAALDRIAHEGGTVVSVSHSEAVTPFGRNSIMTSQEWSVLITYRFPDADDEGQASGPGGA